ncbi:helix-turn-helix domain-containing protein [Streptomyces sp. KMM 9044]|uniref:helix-turn-helix domain-containing protein n=1 Tax=Streptomyces sp. KMM 9044 TaxID=2744474 RepID=UPI002150F27B|nr:helix-turn-helix domain-containing protein [Streptomyces sp. KMM 9044]WAX81775.1 helix-turn-helix domain-containing protein [Streptomyces sp. KMM 9044]
MLRNARTRAGMTQNQLAEISTVSVRAIRDLELDRTGTPRVQTIRLLADALRLVGARRAELEAAAGLRAVRSLYDDLPAPSTVLAPPLAREEEAASLTRLLRSPGHQLIKVTGPPGVGKTSLIQSVAGELHRTEFMPVISLDRIGAAPHGRHEASLRLVRRVAEAIGCDSALTEVAGSLASHDVLLVADERDLDDGDRQDLRVLVQLCRGLRVLLETCTVTVDRAGATTFTLFPLHVPEWSRQTPDPAAADSPVVQYMLARCAPLYPEDVSAPETLTAIAGICWHLDGIPAALESALSWLLIYEPAELLRIAEESPARLTASPSGEHASLVDWVRQALATLPESGMRTLHRLVDAPPWTVKDAVALLAGSGADAEDSLRDLRARGLVRRVKSVRGEPQRFVVLNLVRHLVHSARDPRPDPYDAPVSWGGLHPVQTLAS